MLFSMFSLVSAQPPFQEFSGPEGLELEFQKFEYFQIGEPFTVHAHVFNLSNGAFMDNTTTRCWLHAYYKNGSHAIVSEMVWDPPFDWALEIPATAFTGGKGSWIMQCNSTDGGGIGGFAAGPLVVTPTGFEPMVADAILYGFIILLIGVFLIFVISGIKKAVNGSWQIFYICLTYVVTYALVGIVYLIAHNYLWVVPIIGNIFYIIWFAMAIGFLPFVIVISLYILGKEAKAALEQNYMNQGYSPEEARELSKKNKR